MFGSEKSRKLVRYEKFHVRMVSGGENKNFKENNKEKEENCL